MIGKSNIYQIVENVDLKILKNAKEDAGTIGF